jgi:hypothetical protein
METNLYEIYGTVFMSSMVDMTLAVIYLWQNTQERDVP